MIAVDTNILVYVDREEMPQHAAASAALRELAESGEAWGLPVSCIAEFLRVVTHPGIYQSPTSLGDAFRCLRWLSESPGLRLLSPGPRFLGIFERIVRDAHTIGNRVFDAQIAAVCLENGARTILTEDRDFHRFPGITVKTL